MGEAVVVVADDEPWKDEEGPTLMGMDVAGVQADEGPTLPGPAVWKVPEGPTTSRFWKLTQDPPGVRKKPCGRGERGQSEYSGINREGERTSSQTTAQETLSE